MHTRHIIRDLFSRALLLVGLGVAVLMLTPTVHGQTNIFKANSTTDMTLTTSWTLSTGGTGGNPAAITNADLGIIDSTISAANAAGLTFSSNLTLGGLKITNTALGPVTIEPTTSQNLTLGNASILGNPTLFSALPFSSIDLSNSSANLTLGVNTNITLAASQNWYVGNGTNTPTLTVSGNLGMGVFQLYTVGTGNYNLAGNISGSGLLIVDSTGTTTLSGTNSNSGGVVLSNGTLQIGSATALGTGNFEINTYNMLGTTNITTNNNTVALTTNNLILLDGNVNFGGGAAANLNMGTGTVILGTNITANISGNSLTFGGSIVDGGTTANSDGFGITKTGTGTLVLTNANTFTGNMNLQTGTLSLTNNAALQDAVLNYTGGTLTLTAGAQLALGGVAGTQNIALGTGNVDITTVYGHNATYSGNLTGGNTTSTVTINGAAVQAFSGFSNYTGTTTLNSGTLAINGGGNATAGPIGATAATLVITGGSLDNTSGSNVTLLTNNKQNWNGSFTYAGTGNLNMGTGLVTLGQASTTVTVNANTLTEGGIVTGTGDSLTKAGTYGTLVLAGASNYTGGTTVNAGTLIITASGSNFGAGTFNINSGGTLAVNGSVTMTGATNLNSGGTLDLNNGAGIGTGTLVISGGTLDNTSGSTVTDSNNNAQQWNGDFTFGGSNSLNLGTGAVALSASRTLTLSGNTLTVGGVISGTGFGLTQDGNGTLVLTGINTYTGATVINGGTLTLTGNEHGVTSSTTVNSGAQLNLGNAQSLGAGATLVLNGNTVVAGQQVAVTLDNTSGGVLTESNNNAVQLNGVVNFVGTNALSLGTGAVTLNSNSTLNTEASTLTIGGTIGGGFGLTKNGTGTLVLSGANSYTGATDINGGTLSVSTMANGGVNSGIGASSNAATNLVIANNGTLQYTGGGATTDRSFTMGEFTSTLDASGTGALVFNSTTNGTINFNPTNTSNATGGPAGYVTASTSDTLILTGTSGAGIVNTLNLAIQNNGASNYATSVIKNGSGEWALGGNNTYSGQTVLNAGTLSLTNGGNINSSAIGLSTLVINGGTLDNTSAGAVTLATNNAVQLNNSFGFAGTKALGLGTGAVTLNNSTPITITMANTAGSTLTIGGVIGDNGLGYGLTLAGGGASGGTLVLSGANTFSGNMNVTGGTLDLTSNLALQNAILNQTAGTVTFGTTNATLGGLAGSVNIAGEALTINSAKSLNTTYTGVLSGAGSLTMNGSGTEDLSIAQTYTAGTTVNGGTLIESGANNFTAAGNVTVTGGNLTLNGTTNTFGNVSVSGGIANFTTTVTSTGSFTISGGTLLLGGTSVNTLSANTVTLSGGTLDFNKSGAIGTDTLTITSGILDNTNATLTNANTNAQNWNGNFTFQGTNSLNMGTGAVSMNANRTLTVSANTLTIGGIVSGSTFSLTKNGTGTLVLNGNDTYSGGTTVNAGTLVLAGGGATIAGTTTLAGGKLDINAGNATNSALGTSTLTITGGTLDSGAAGVIVGTNNVQNWNGNFTFGGTNALNLGKGNITLGQNEVVNLNASTLTVGGNISGAFSLTINGSLGTLDLAPNSTNKSTYSGGTTINGGTLLVDFANLGTGNTDVIKNGSALVLGGGNLSVLGMAAGGTTNSQTFGSTTLTTGTASSITMNRSTDTTLTLALGGITRNAGSTLNIINPLATGNVVTTSSTGNLNGIATSANGGGIAYLTVGGNDWAAAGSPIVKIASYTAATATNWSTATSNLQVTATTALTSAEGTINSLQFNTTGAADTVTLMAGTLTIGTGGILVASTDTKTNLITGGNISGSKTATGELVVIQNSASAFTIASNILNNSGNTTGLTKSGTGQLILSGANAYNGTTYLDQGTLSLNFVSTATTSALGNGSLDALVINGGTLDNLNASSTVMGNTSNVMPVTFNNSFTFAGTHDLNMGTGADTVNSNLTLTMSSATSTLTVGGAISGTGGFTLAAGSGTLVLSGANSYTGGTTVNGGTLTQTGVNSGAANFTVNGGTLNLNGANTITGNTTLNSGNLNLGEGIAANTTNSAIGTGILVINGGTLDNTNGSAMTLGTNNTIDLNGNFTFKGTNNLNLGVGAETLGKNVTVTMTNATSSLTLGGIISGANEGLTLAASSGTLQLSGNNTYTGGTTVNGGTLLQTGNYSGTGAFTVNAGTLTMNGANTITGNTNLVSGNLNLNNGSVGNTTASSLGTGTLVISGGTLDNTSGAAVTLGTNNAINLNGSFTFAGSNGANSNLNLGTGAVTLGHNEVITTSNAASTLTVGGVISGGYSLTKNGTGDLVLSGANTYTGGTVINGGILEANNTNALGANGTYNTVTVNSTATLQLDNGFGAGALGSSNNSLLSLNGTGVGTGNLAGALVVSGGTAQWAGNVTLAASATIGAGNTANNVLTVGRNPAILVQPTTTNITLGANTLTFVGGQNTKIVVDSQINGTGGINVNMDSNATNSANNGIVDFNMYGNGYTGTTQITNGTLIVETQQNNPAVTTDNGNLTAINGPVIIGTGVNAGNTSILQLGNLTDTTAAINPMSKNTNVTINADGKLFLSYGATQTINNLTINGGGYITSNDTAGIGYNGTLTVEGVTTVNGAANTTFIDGFLNMGNSVGNATNVFNVVAGSNTTSDLTINGLLSGGSLLKTGNGIMTLTNANNSYTGTTEIAAGTLAISGSSANATSNALSSLGASNSSTLGQGTTVDSGGQLALQGVTINGESLTLNGNGTNGSNGALKNQSGDSVYNGTTYIGANNATINTDAGNLTLAGNISNVASTPTLTIVGNNTTTTITGLVSGALNLNLSANGSNTNTVVMSGSNVNTYTGNTTVNANTTLTLARTGGTNNSIAAGTITVNQGGTLLSDTTEQINTAANMNLNGGTWTTNVTSGAFSEKLGTLTLSMSSNIDLGSLSTSNNITFAASNLNTWTPGATLYINGWNGVFSSNYTGSLANNGGNGYDIISFSSAAGLGGTSYTGQLGDIIFVNPEWNGVSYTGDFHAVIEASGEVVPFLPAPEPGTVAAGASLAVLAMLREWRKRKDRAVVAK